MFLLLVPLLLQAVDPASLPIRVVAPNGHPLKGVIVHQGKREATTDAKGTCVFPGAQAGDEFTFKAPGFVDQTLRWEPSAGTLLVMMTPQERSATVVVEDTSEYSSDEGSSSSLGKIDIYTTPGAAADVFQAIKGMPGVSQTTEGAELYVRGGNPSEVGIYLNQGKLARPYQNLDNQGGIFSSVDTAMVNQVTFIPGGFSVRYGDALSAVLDLSTDQPSPVSSRTLTLTMPGAGFLMDEPLGRGVFRGSLRHNDPIILEKSENLGANFQESPISDDMHLNLQGVLGDSGHWTATGLFANNHLGVDSTQGNLTDLFVNKSGSEFGTLAVDQSLGVSWVLRAATSVDLYHQTWSFNRWGLHQVERTDFGRAEAIHQFDGGTSLDFGWDGDRTYQDNHGLVPLDPLNWTPSAPNQDFHYGFSARRSGGYLSIRLPLGTRCSWTLGGRADHYGLEGQTTHDLRTSFSWQVSPGHTFRCAYGTFHQSAGMQRLDPFVGNPRLLIQRATHALIGYDAAWEGSISWNLRVEAYRKDYGNLAAQDPTLNYVSSGYGFAQGLDLFVKARGSGWRAWMGYGYLDTRRKENDQPVLGTVATSVPHNFTAVGILQVTEGWEVSTAWRYSTGGPVTPILGGMLKGGNPAPILGTPFSERLPAYQRVDLRLTRYFSSRTIAFAEITNLLNRFNAIGYTYSPDFTTRNLEPSFFAHRVLVAGISLSW